MVLVLQILPGHFQLAFMTQFVVVLIVAWSAIERWGGACVERFPSVRRSLSFQHAPGAGVALALAAVFPLAAIQLWPTARLAGLAAGQRDFEYLSGFASTPFHLVNFVAPGLFHRSPLWRPLGMGPVSYLARGASRLHRAGSALSGWHGSSSASGAAIAAVRLLAILLIATFVLSLGPYVPGFRQLIRLPGFSFFRAPSRWMLATSLALALLAGKGFDGWAELAEAGPIAGAVRLAALLWVVAIVGLIELALVCTSSPGWPVLARGFQRVFDAMPWKGDPSVCRRDGRRARPCGRPAYSGRSQPVDVPAEEWNGGRVCRSSAERSTAIELWETAALLAVLWVIARMSETRTARARQGALAARRRHVPRPLGPGAPSSARRRAAASRWCEQSPVLAALAREPRGTRIAGDRLKNMPMLVGQAPISAYRTLDLPAVPELTVAAHGPMGVPAIEPLVRRALRATGTGLRVLDPIENRNGPRAGHVRASLAKRSRTPRWRDGSSAQSWVADLGSMGSNILDMAAPRSRLPAPGWLPSM